MLKYKDKVFSNRKELKSFLGGRSSYDRAMKNGDILFINDLNIAIDESKLYKE